MAALDPGVTFVAMADAVSPDNPASFDADGVHPSPSASQAIGEAVARAIRSAEGL